MLRPLRSRFVGVSVRATGRRAVDAALKLADRIIGANPVASILATDRATVEIERVLRAKRVRQSIKAPLPHAEANPTNRRQMTGR